MSNNTKKPWGGRFKGKTNEFVESFTSSIAFDYRLWPYDLRVTIAHSKMLKEIGVLNEAELKEILGAIEKLDEMFEKGDSTIDLENDDVILADTDNDGRFEPRQARTAFVHPINGPV